MVSTLSIKVDLERLSRMGNLKRTDKSSLASVHGSPWKLGKE
jgi:hypothetical protein